MQLLSVCFSILPSSVGLKIGTASPWFSRSPVGQAAETREPERVSVSGFTCQGATRCVSRWFQTTIMCVCISWRCLLLFLLPFFLLFLSLIYSSPYLSALAPPRLHSLLQSVSQTVRAVQSSAWCRGQRLHGIQPGGAFDPGPKGHIQLQDGELVSCDATPQTYIHTHTHTQARTHTATTDHLFPLSTTWSRLILLLASLKISQSGEMSVLRFVKRLTLKSEYTWIWPCLLLILSSVYIHKITNICDINTFPFLV